MDIAGKQTRGKRTETKRRWENILSNKILNSIPYPVYLIDVNNYRLKLVSRATEIDSLSDDVTCYAAIFGINEPCGENVCPLKQIKKTKKSVVLERVHCDKDNNPRNIAIHGYPVLGSDGNVLQVVAIWIDITERKRAEEALRVSEENFRNIMDSSPLGIRIVTADGETIYANRTLLDIYGYGSVEELQSTLLIQRYTAESHAEHQVRKERRKLNLPVPNPYEINVVRKDGETRCLRVHYKEVTWEGRREYQVIYEDITEEKRAQTALRVSEENFRNIMDNFPLGINVFTTDHEPIYTNKAALDIYGCSNVEELRSTPKSQLYTPDSYSEYLTRKEERRLGLPSPEIFEIGILRKDSEVRYVRMHRQRVTWAGKSAYMATLENITDRKIAEEDSRQSKFKLDLILGQLPCILWTTDDKLTISLSTGAGLPNLGFKPGQLVGMSLYDYFNTDDPEFPPIQAHRRALTGDAVDYELKRSGLVLNCHVEPIRDSSGSVIGVSGVSFDITRSKIAEERLRSLSRRLIEIQEEERSAIARELHDQIGQSLYVVSLLLERVANPTEKNASSSLISEAKVQVDDLFSRVRNLSLDLRPSMLDNLGLLDALVWYLKRYRESTKVRVNFKHYGLNQPIDTQVATAVYRLVQESLTNVARHAGVNQATVSIWADQQKVNLRIEDKGVGFNPSHLSASKSNGINGMYERVFAVGGNLVIDSASGTGTRILAEIPLSNEDNGNQ